MFDFCFAQWPCRAYFFRPSKASAFRLPGANHCLAAANHRLVGANYRLVGANQKSFQTRPTKTAGWAHLNGENEGRNAAEGCDVATLFVPCRPLAVGGRSAAFEVGIVAKNPLCGRPRIAIEWPNVGVMLSLNGWGGKLVGATW